ncbi:MAG TPA: protease complex subunit PrcB family protein [Vicinamibacteria bacterium]|nr:protease complex subunit PrcB family protein [Vicinamibacteria bacterium]
MSPEAARLGAGAGLLLAASALLAACAAAGPRDTGDVEHPFEALLAEAHSGLAEPRREVVRDEAGWARMWAEIHAGVTPAPPRPAVDFGRHMLVVVASGTRPSGGFAIKVRSVATRGGKVEVVVLETCPAPDAMVTMELTQPVEVVRVPMLTQPVAFQEARAGSCR